MPKIYVILLAKAPQRFVYVIAICFHTGVRSPLPDTTYSATRQIFILFYLSCGITFAGPRHRARRRGAVILSRISEG